MNTPIPEGIVEVQECHLRKANEYLAAGYVLLYEGITTHERTKRDGQLYISREFQYVVGRTADVAHFEPAPKAQPVEATE
jgi:hypothetical protein